MANLAGILKTEIRRLARKEVKAELAATKKASAQYRRDIAALKRQIHDQARHIGSLERSAKRDRGTGANGSVAAARFSPKWLQAHREKLALSAADYGALVGVTAQTIYNWEKGQTRPQPQQLEAWANVRKLGKREAWRQLEQMDA